MRKLDIMSENTETVRTAKPVPPPAGHCTPCGAKLGDAHGPDCPVKAATDRIRKTYARGGSL